MTTSDARPDLDALPEEPVALTIYREMKLDAVKFVIAEYDALIAHCRRNIEARKAAELAERDRHMGAVQAYIEDAEALKRGLENAFSKSRACKQIAWDWGQGE